MKKRLFVVLISAILIFGSVLSASAKELSNWDFSNEESPITLAWTDGEGSVTVSDGRLMINAGPSKGIETTNFNETAMDNFELSYQYYPTGDWFTDSLYFHHTNNDNCYTLRVIGNQNDDDWAKESRRTVTLLKKENGTETELAKAQLSAMPASGNDCYSVKIVYSDGLIKVYFSAGETLSTDALLTAEDATPLAAGDIKFFKYDNISYLDNVILMDDEQEITPPADDEQEVTPPADDENGDPKTPLIDWTFSKSTDELPLSNVSTAGGMIRWESGRVKIMGRTVGDQLVSTTSTPLTDKAVKDFFWRFDYEPEHLDWGVDRFLFHAADLNNTFELRILGNLAKELTNDVNTTGGGDAHNIKLIQRTNGVNTLLGSYDLPYGLDLENYSVQITMKGSEIKVWFAPKSAGLGEAVIEYACSSLSDEFSEGQFIIDTYAGNFLIDNVIVYNTATPDILNEDNTNSTPGTDDDANSTPGTDDDTNSTPGTDDDANSTPGTDDDTESSPNTGDDIGLLFLVLAVAALAFATMVVTSRKQSHTNA